MVPVDRKLKCGALVGRAAGRVFALSSRSAVVGLAALAMPIVAFGSTGDSATPPGADVDGLDGDEHHVESLGDRRQYGDHGWP